MASMGFAPSDEFGLSVLNCPAGVKSRLPSGANVRRRKNVVMASFAYIGAFLAPRPLPPNGIGECSMGRTAGSGMEGAGDADLPTEGDPNDERRLCVYAGGFIGKAKELGVPGTDGVGAGDAGAFVIGVSIDLLSGRLGGLNAESEGAGLFEILLPGRSTFATLLCCLRANSPSFVRNE